MAKRCFALNGMPILVAALIIATSPCATADDHTNGQTHGFVSQAAVFSDGNNIAGNSRSGSLRFSEVGLSGSIFYKNILFAGQIVSVHNPIPGSAKPALDYAVADIPLFSASANEVGIRIGRPKLPFRLYADVRDVAGYLEARGLFSNHWEAFLRYEEFWAVMGDRSGRKFSAGENRPVHSGYAFETGLEVKRNFENGVSVMAETHYIDGAGTVDRLANLDAFTGPPAGQGDSSLLASSWSYFALQLAYKC
jgi:hypothetical protein